MLHDPFDQTGLSDMKHRVIVVPEKHCQTSVEANRFPYRVYDYVFSSQGEHDAYVKGLRAMANLAEYEFGEATAATQEILIDGKQTVFQVGNELERRALLMGLEDGDGWEAPKLFSRSEDADDFERVAAILSDKAAVTNLSKEAVTGKQRNEILSKYLAQGITLLATAMAAATDMELIGIPIGEDVYDVRVSRRSLKSVFNPARGEIEDDLSEMVSLERVEKIPGDVHLDTYPDRYSNAELEEATRNAILIFGDAFAGAVTHLPKRPSPQLSARPGI
jgi:hypothetical protein